MHTDGLSPTGIDCGFNLHLPHPKMLMYLALMHGVFLLRCLFVHGPK